MDNTVYKGFIKDWEGKTLLPITRGELVLDSNGTIALQSEQFLAENGHPGLLRAEERALINSLTGANGELGQVADIYTKLGHLNVLKFGTQDVYHYNTETGDRTPITITSDNIGIAVNTLNNQVTFSLKEVAAGTKIENQIIKNIEVDKYGRVLSVDVGDLTINEIPQTLSGKVLQNCTTEGEPSANNSIVNKAYVDAQFQNIAAVSTGSIKFKGALTSADSAYGALTDENLYSYYIIASGFDIYKRDVYKQTAIGDETINVQVGDTLVIYKDVDNVPKFVYIPSGDDKTTISITNTDDLTSLYTSSGHVVLKLQDIFDITQQSNIAVISLKEASLNTGGYLSKKDWERFNSYASQESTTYTGIFNATNGYEIGTLTIAGVENKIYGNYNDSYLSLEDGDTNPILKFTSSLHSDVNISVKGVNGIITKKTIDGLEISANYEIAKQEIPNTSTKTEYLTVDEEHKLGVKLGKLNQDGSIEDGLVDFRQMLTTIAVYADHHFEIIPDSLTDTSQDYYYGSTKLIEAITLTI